MFPEQVLVDARHRCCCQRTRCSLLSLYSSNSSCWSWFWNSLSRLCHSRSTRQRRSRHSMGVLQGNHVHSAVSTWSKSGIYNREMATHFLKGTSATRSFPPLILSARKTFPVVAIATIWECSLKGLNEMGS